MSKLIKDIVDVCLKEDLQKVLQKTTELKEASAFGREFAQQMKQKGEGGVYTSKVTGQNVLLKYASPKTAAPKQAAPVSAPRPSAPVSPAPPVTRSLTARPAAPSPAAKVSAPLPPPRPATMPPPAASKVSAPLPPVKPAAPTAAPMPTQTARDMMQNRIQSKFDRMATTDAANQTKTTPPVSPKFGRIVPPTSTTSAPPPTNMSAPPTKSYSLPPSKDVEKDIERSQTSSRGIRNLKPGDVVNPKDYQYPGSASPEGRATEPPTKSNVAPEPAPKPEPETSADGSGARKMGIPVPTTPAKPDEPGYSDYMKGAERLKRDVGSRYVPESINESFVNVGSNKYRIV